MPMEGDIYALLLSLLLVACLLYWARDLGEQQPNLQKTKAALKSGLRSKRHRREGAKP